MQPPYLCNNLIISFQPPVMHQFPKFCHHLTTVCWPQWLRWLPLPILSALLPPIASWCAVWEAWRGQQAALSSCWLKTLHGLKAADCQGVSTSFYPQARPELRQSQAEASCLDFIEASACSGGKTKLCPVCSILNVLPGCCRSGVHLDTPRKS